MTHLSLARIMYGTNEDLHSSPSMQSPSLTSHAIHANSSGGAAPRPESVGAWLHRAWLSFTKKG